MNKKNISDKIRVKRLAERGAYDFETIRKILDDSFLCHIGFIINNQPFIIPTSYGRKDEWIFFHGAKNSRMLKNLQQGIDVCISITHVDGLVLARSAFHHSMNYRSVVIYGNAQYIENEEEKNEALRIISEQICPGRWNDVRLPTKKELHATTVLKMKIGEASAKIRTGPPKDEEEDYELDIWAGVLPFETITKDPLMDERLKAGISVPDYVKNYKKNK